MQTPDQAGEKQSSIDNLNRILPFLQFESPDDFYYLQILQRKKENPEVGSNSRVIKNYYITSIEHLEKQYTEIKALCHQFNARAMIRLNKRSFESVAFKSLENVANSMRNREYKFIKNSYDRACGLGHNDPEKKWILDVDVKDNELIAEICASVVLIPPVRLDKVLSYIPSKSGEHIITRPFNLHEFSNQYPEIEVHKDNPTNLYIP